LSSPSPLPFKDASEEISENEKAQTLANGSTLLSSGIPKNGYVKDVIHEKLASKQSIN
jgi:hypothetical protein